MNITNKQIACKPFERTSVEVTVKGGLPQLKQKRDLTKLEVVFGCEAEDYAPGDYVWVRGDAMKHSFAREVYEVDGKDFILIPTELVVGVEHNS